MTRAYPHVGWFALALALAFAAAAVALAIANAAGERSPPGYELLGPLAIAYLLGFLVFPAAGALIVSRLPRHPIGWIFLVSGLVIEASMLLMAYAERALVTHPGTLPAGDAAAWFADWLDISVPLLASFGLLLFPDGRLPSRRWRAVAWAAAASIGGIVIYTALRPGTLDSGIPAERPVTASWIEPLEIAWLAFVLVALASSASLVVRYRRSSGTERQQLRWIAIAGATLALGLLAAAVGYGTAGDEGGGVIALAGILAGLAAMAGSITVALLRYRLYELDVVVNRTLVYAALTASVIGVYVGVVVGVGALIKSAGIGVSLLGAGAVAVLVIPLRQVLQRRVDRLMYGDRADPYRALTGLTARLADALEPGAAMPAIVDSVSDALRLPYAAIELPDGAGHRVVASRGEYRGGGLERLDLTYQGEVVGRLVVAPRTPGERLAREDLGLLEDLARRAGVAVHSARLTDDLRHSRELLIGAREEERRSLRRALHDGLGPALAGIALELESARALAPNDPDAAGERLARAKEGIQAGVEEIRRIARGLTPEGG